MPEQIGTYKFILSCCKCDAVFSYKTEEIEITEICKEFISCPKCSVKLVHNDSVSKEIEIWDTHHSESYDGEEFKKICFYCGVDVVDGCCGKCGTDEESRFLLVEKNSKDCPKTICWNCSFEYFAVKQGFGTENGIPVVGSVCSRCNSLNKVDDEN